MSSARSRIWILAFATAAIVASVLGCVYVFGPASDAVWYLGAGERLNAGHLLYALSPGDRPIQLDPPFYTSPFLYPPSFALVWRPLAALPLEAGLWAWWAATGFVLVTWLGRRMREGGLRTALAALVLAFPIGQTIATANLNGFVLVAFGVCWIWRDRPRASGLVVGMLTAWKLFPGFLILWMVLTRRWRAAGWAIGAFAAWTVAGLLLLGPDVTFTYLRDVLPATEPMGISVGYLSGAPFLGYLAALIGLAAAWLLRRQASTSYAISSLTAILAWPSLGIASLCILFGVGPALSDVFGHDHSHAAATRHVGDAKPLEPGSAPQVGLLRSLIGPQGLSETDEA